jgi:hypothetical protein
MCRRKLTYSFSLQQFFGIESDLAVAAETLTAWAETVRQMYDGATFVRYQQFKMFKSLRHLLIFLLFSPQVGQKPFRVRFVCVDSQNSFNDISPGQDPDDEFYDDALGKCNFERDRDPDRGEEAAVTFNVDNDDPDCLPAIYLCPTFSTSSLFLAVNDGTQVSFNVKSPSAEDMLTPLQCVFKPETFSHCPQ